MSVQETEIPILQETENLGEIDSRVNEAADALDFLDGLTKDEPEVEIEVDVEEDAPAKPEAKEPEAKPEPAPEPARNGLSNEEITQALLDIHNNNLALQKEIKALREASTAKSTPEKAGYELPDSLEESVAVLAKRYKLPEHEVVAKMSRAMAMRDEPDNLALRDELLELKQEFRNYRTSVEEAAKAQAAQAQQQAYEARLGELANLVEGMHADPKAIETYPHLAGVPAKERSARMIQLVKSAQPGEQLIDVFRRAEQQAKTEWEARTEWYNKIHGKQSESPPPLRAVPDPEPKGKIPQSRGTGRQVPRNGVALYAVTDEDSISLDDVDARIQYAAQALPL
jgi:hypothetical protein